MTDEQINSSELSANMRFYGEMRFKQITLLMAGMTAAGAGAIQFAPERGPIAITAAVFAGVMWVMEVRSTLYWAAFREKVPEDLKPSPEAAFWPWLNATNVVLALHVFFVGFWIWVASTKYSALLTCLPGGIILLALAIFTGKNYWPLWTHKKAGQKQSSS